MKSYATAAATSVFGIIGMIVTFGNDIRFLTFTVVACTFAAAMLVIGAIHDKR